MFERFSNRSHDLERLDTGDYTDAEYKLWQREMGFIHAVFGEERALKQSLIREIDAGQDKSVSILDVGAGTGILLRRIGKMLPNHSLERVGLELELKSARLVNDRHVSGVQGNGTRLPFADGAFDYAYCTLLLHHLGDGDAVELIREMDRVASKGIYVIDLNRDPVAYFTYRFLGRMLLQPLTLEDGALSILRSFTREELLNLAEAAGLRSFSVRPSKVNRLILSAGKA